MRRSDRRRLAKPTLFRSRGRRIAGSGEHEDEDEGPESAAAIEPVAGDISGDPEVPPSVSRKKRPPGPQKRTMPVIADEEDEEPSALGWRASRRTSRAGKQARRAAKADATRVKAEARRAKVGEKLTAGGNAVLRVLKIVVASVLAIVIAGGSLWGAALGINAFARWNAKRLADAAATGTPEDKTRENVVVIGVKDDQAVGFVAMKAERSAKRVLGIAIPDGAFMEVPGQGFERVGVSYEEGPLVSRDAIANFLTVPFHRYIVVDDDAYQGLVTKQRVSTLVSQATATNLTKEDKADLDTFLKSVKSRDVWIVPLPVKPVAVGDERYYEPQRDEIADIVVQWWGAHIDQQKPAIRLIVYNGVGTPGVAGKAAQQLIRKGFRVVDSRNAENFGYKTTQILLYHGTDEDAAAVREALGGVGEVIAQSAAQNVADMIVVIGEDYVPPAGP